MPNFNGQGPRNEGPMTGRGLGYCAVVIDSDEKAANISSRPRQRVFGRGRGGQPRGCSRGRGGRWGNRID